MTKTLIDTGPLLAAIDSSDAAHAIAAPIVATLQRKAVIPTPVLVEFDHLAAKRVGRWVARSFLKATASPDSPISA